MILYVLFIDFVVSLFFCVFFFFFNDTATTEIYTLSLHDALPICSHSAWAMPWAMPPCCWPSDRKSTRLNSSHQIISYAVFCLKKKKKTNNYIKQQKTKKKKKTKNNPNNHT